MTTIIGYNKRTKKYYVGSQIFNSKSERDAYLDTVKTLAKRIKKTQKSAKEAMEKIRRENGVDVISFSKNQSNRWQTGCSY